MTAVSEKDAVICIHDDYCIDIEAAEISQILLKIGELKICEYLEKGIYTIEMFTKRNDTLTREIHKVQAAENELLKKQGAQKDIHDVEKEIIPTTQHILDSYPQLSVEEKNRLWKIVMERITAYRTPGGEVSIHIYPKLPMR